METQIVGRLTADARVNTTNSGKQVVNFDVAVNERYRVKVTGELKSNVQFVQCSFWFNSVVAKFLTKGKLVEIKGDVGVKAYLNREGKPAASLTLRAIKIKFHDKSISEGKNTNAVPAAATNEEGADNLPF